MGQSETGPVNQAMTVASLAEFRKYFGGGDWPLSRAVCQYFASGGSELAVVRIANGARAATLTLPAGDLRLTLRAANPGRLESIRAAIDHDAIGEDDRSFSFNLTLQRLVGEQSRIVDQEIYRAVSIRPESPENVRDVLRESEIAEVAGELPLEAPRSMSQRNYAGIAEPGSDGQAISVYDLIGSSEEGTGLFALDDLDQLDFLYVPDLEGVQGATVLFEAAAERYVSSRSAMLVLDPPVESQQAAIRPDSANFLSYSERPVRRQKPTESVAIGATLIGLLDEATRTGRPGAGTEHLQGSLGRGLILGPSASVTGHRHRGQMISVDLRERLDGRIEFYEDGDVPRLSAHRLRLAVQRSVRKATRWLVFVEPSTKIWQDLEQQVGDYLAAMSSRGLIAADERDLPWFVRCDPLTNNGVNRKRRETRFLFGYCPRGSADMQVFSVAQSLSGADVGEAAFCPVFRRPA